MSGSGRFSMSSSHRGSAAIAAAVLLVFGLVHAGPAPPAAADEGTRSQWQGGHSIYWADEKNWSDGVPGSDDVAVVDLDQSGNCAAIEAGAVSVAGLELTVCANLYATSITAERVTVSGTSLLRGPTTVTDEMTWTGGTLVYDVVVPAGATLTSSGTGARVANSITVHGSLVLDGGTTTVYNSGVTGDGVIRADANSRIEGSAPVRNSGTLDVGSSTLTIAGPSLLTSGRTALAGGALRIQDGAHEFLAGARFTGSGRVRLSGPATGATLQGHGTLVLDPAVVFEVAGGQQYGQLVVQGGSFAWTGGRLNGVLTVDAGTTASVSGDDPKTVNGQLVNLGTMTWLSGAPIEIFNAGVRNEGTLTVPEDVEVTGGGTLSSPGTLRLLRAGLVVDGPSFDGSGPVVMTAGTLRLKAGAHRLSDGTTISGTGQLLVQSDLTGGGTVTLAKGITLALAGGPLRGTLDVDGGTVRWTSGAVWANLGIGATTTLVATGSTAKQLSGSFVNDGAIQLGGGALTLGQGLLNRGTVTVTTAARLVGGGVVTNARAGRILLAARLTVSGPTLTSYGRIALGTKALALGAGAHALKSTSILATTVNGTTKRGGKLTTAGSLALDGRVQVAEAAKAPKVGTRVTLLTAQPRSGRFTSVRGLGHRDWSAAYTTISVVIRAR